ncbi:response regulator transcription factor [Clostridium sp. MB40-C1]|uniref:response regulator transcription factor n=1 Tax=Clostridium sp. MB40-C1 TaxID=3070996 RepID=UPI0027E17B2B|nr:response regulator transcription factor [Clostridium sp. MB40-C1]WMJ79363.1 response regulator transcription factor [Clostridium sp. MB40-C1]
MKVLVIDDEESIVNLIKMNLMLEGYEVIYSLNGKDGIKKFKYENPDLVLLDLMLPDIDGYEVIKNLQAIDIEKPIIMLTAKSQINSKLLGLQLGADDYITKPFDSRELLLRIRAIYRRINKSKLIKQGEVEKSNTIKRGNIRILLGERKVFVNDKEVELTYKEFDTLALMAKNHKKVYTREELLEKIWGYDFIGNSRTVDIHIQRLRKKLKGGGKHIKTLYGVGYKFEVIKDEI